MHFSNFNCSLSWMFHSRTLNNNINRLHERYLRIKYNDNTSSFTDLLEIDNSLSVHYRNIQVLATELYKFINGLSLKLVDDCFKLNNMTVYNTRNKFTLYSRPVRTVLHGTESFSHWGPKIWEFVPSNTKNLSSHTAFKKAIKQWKSHASSCRLCRAYIYEVVWFRDMIKTFDCIFLSRTRLRVNPHSIVALNFIFRACFEQGVS